MDFINLTRIIFFIFLFKVSSCEVHIEPDTEELLVTSGATFELQCIGDREVKWTYPPDFEFQSTKKEKSYRLPDGRFKSDLLITKAYYMDTGFYQCSEIRNELEEKQLYIYVRDASALLAVDASEGQMLTGTQYEDLIIPCRPTSPDTNVTLLKEDEEVDVRFDPKKGFTLQNLKVSDSAYYICIADRSGQIKEEAFEVKVFPKTERVQKPVITVEGVEGAHIIAGQDVVLLCHVFLSPGVHVTLDWEIPTKASLEKVSISDTHTERTTSRGPNSPRKSYKKLEIKNVSTNEQGNYTCLVNDHAMNTNENSFKLEVFPIDLKYLNLSMEGKSEIEVRVTEKEAQWIVHVDAYPQPVLIWHGPENETLHQNDKYSISTDSKSTKVTIHNITIDDSGSYTLHASNSVKNETLRVILLVQDRPKVSFIPNHKSYFYINKEEVVNVSVTANPVPIVECNFTECKDYRTFCAPEFLGENSKITDTLPMESIGAVKWLMKLKWYPRESGKITCRARNDLGESQAHIFIKVTDVEDGFEIWGPKHRVLNSESVVIGCGASIYEYEPFFQWIHISSSGTQKEEVLSNSSRRGITITMNQTSFSYQTFLNLEDLNSDNSGTFKCRFKSLIEKTYEEREFKLLVQSMRAPNFTDYNNMNGSTRIQMLGHPLVLNCSVVGVPDPAVLWYKDGKELKRNDRIILENRNTSLIFKHTEPDDAGIYRCVASNNAGKKSGELVLKLKGVAVASKVLWWIFLVLILVSVACVIVAITFCRKFNKEKEKRKELIAVGLYNFKEGDIKHIDPNIDIGEQADLLPYDKKWEFPRSQLKLGKQLGSGAFGVVVKGEAMGLFEDDVPVTVAVKMVKKSSDITHIKSLATELKIMAHLGRHLNVVNLLGACTGNIHKRELLVLVEYCRYGNLRNYILHHRSSFINLVDPDKKILIPSPRNNINLTELTYITNQNQYQTNTGLSSEYTNGQSVHTDMTTVSTHVTPVGDDGYLLSKDFIADYQGDYKTSHVRPISTEDLILWGYEVARGMEYLSSRKVLHGDLAARNVLLAEGNVVKISDFGLAKSLYSRENYSNKKRSVPLPVKWMSIESIRDGIFSTQSDVWSFGVFLWELFSLGATPYPEQVGNEFIDELLKGERMSKPSYSTDDIYELMLECWKEKPMLRPTFRECAERLGAMLGESVKEHYIELNCPYEEFNKSIENDHLSKLVEPTYENMFNTGIPEVLNEGYVCMKPSETDALNDLELQPMMVKPGCNSFLNPGYQDMKKFTEHSYRNLAQCSNEPEVSS